MDVQQEAAALNAALDALRRTGFLDHTYLGTVAAVERLAEDSRQWDVSWSSSIGEYIVVPYPRP